MTQIRGIVRKFQDNNLKKEECNHAILTTVLISKTLVYSRLINKEGMKIRRQKKEKCSVVEYRGIQGTKDSVIHIS